MSMYPSSNIQWSDWVWDPNYGQHFRSATDANGQSLIQWESELAPNPSTPRGETDDVPDISALAIDSPSPGDGDQTNYTTEASSKSKSKSKSHKSSKKESKSSKSKSKSSHRKGKSRAQDDDEEEEEEPDPTQTGRVYFDHQTGQYLPYPEDEQDPGQYGTGDGDDAELEAYHQSRKYSGDQYSAGGPADSAYGAYEPAEPEEAPPPARAEEHITGTEGDYEMLDPRYTVVHSSYFQPGEVFKVLWPEPAGSRSAPTYAEGSTKGAPSVVIYPDQYGGQIFAHFRRFIVIANDYGHCQCVPISTYGKKGCTKSGAKPSQHGIVHDVRSRPHLLSHEPELGYRPVRLEITDPSEKISRESRVNYAKLTTVEHNVKVLFVGRVIPEDLSIAKDAVDDCWRRKTHTTRRYRRQ
ncbi:hypothetical protein NCS52_01275900 [Fusarium sp. LHS14.1]|nr:hypothetical protein NCS52_01275900 [Fusarium sp. LHS14.1]